MTKHAIETVMFRLAGSVSPEQFLKAAEPSTAFLNTRQGFIHRRLSMTSDGMWIEHIEWASMEDAKAAAAAIGEDASVGPFMAAIDGSSVQFMHSTLELSVG